MEKKLFLSAWAIGALAVYILYNDDEPPIAAIVATCNDGIQIKEETEC